MRNAQGSSEFHAPTAPVTRGAAFELVALERAIQELALCDSLPRVKDLRDQAQAFRQYAQNAREGLELLNKAAEFKLWAERRAGELLAQLKLHGGDRVSESGDQRMTLEQLGINPHQSCRWQKMAKIPEQAFREFLSAARENGAEISSAALLRFAAMLQKKRPVNGHRRPAKTEETETVARSSPWEIINEMQNHCEVIDSILADVYDTPGPINLKAVQKRHLRRLVCDFRSLLGELKSLAASTRNDT